MIDWRGIMGDDDTPTPRRRADDVTIRQYVDQRNAEVERRIDDLRREVEQRFTHQERVDGLLKESIEEAIRARVDERRQAIDAIERQMASHQNSHDREHQLTQEALSKAEATMDKRLESVAEGARQRQEMASDLITRSEHEQVRQQVEGLSASSVTRREFDDTRRLVYMGLGMAVLGPVLLSLIFYLGQAS